MSLGAPKYYADELMRRPNMINVHQALLSSLHHATDNGELIARWQLSLKRVPDGYDITALFTLGDRPPIEYRAEICSEGAGSLFTEQLDDAIRGMITKAQAEIETVLDPTGILWLVGAR